MTSFDETNESPVMPTTFAELGLSDPLLQAVALAGYETPSPIQMAAIPAILSGSDVVGMAHTGSGKTAAFVLPTLDRLLHNQNVEILVLTPTRELAQQIVTEVDKLSKFVIPKASKAGVSSKRALGIGSVSVVGGQPYRPQIEGMNGQAKLVVATPGRMIDHLESGHLKRFAPHIVILDEADEMLDMGFIDDIRSIFRFLPTERQVLMFSATMPTAIKSLMADLMKDPVFVNGGRKATDKPLIEQILLGVRPAEKLPALLRLIDFEDPDKAIVFCRTRTDTDEVCKYLQGEGIMAGSLHGDMSQSARNEVTDGFRKSIYKVLVATDVASRGLDFSEVSHVFNFHIPENGERYTHRIGRTGRAGRQGKAMTLATPGDLSNHRFFRTLPPKSIELSEIPSRQAVDEKRTRALLEELNAVEISASAQEMATKMGLSAETDAFTLKLLTHVLNSQRVRGPKFMGLNKEDLAKALNGSRPSRSNGEGRSYGARPNRGGGPLRRPANGGTERSRSNAGNGSMRRDGERDSRKRVDSRSPRPLRTFQPNNK